MKIFSYGVLSAAILTLTLACSSTQSSTSTSDNSSNSVYPGWYNTSEFQADSLNYHGFATAINADSSEAVDRAIQQAKVHLEYNIGDITEEIRTALVENGSTDADNTDFIIILRKAHAAVGAAAEISEVSAGNSGNYYRAFAAVSISKSKVAEVLEDGFTGHPRYWGGFSSAPLFVKHFE